MCCLVNEYKMMVRYGSTMADTGRPGRTLASRISHLNHYGDSASLAYEYRIISVVSLLNYEFLSCLVYDNEMNVMMIQHYYYSS